MVCIDLQQQIFNQPMNLKMLILTGILLGSYLPNLKAQIYSQGKNINKEKVYFLEVELVPKPMDASKYHAAINFSGKRQDITWFIKQGVEHKAFTGQDDMIGYLLNNGWFYLGRQVGKSRYTTGNSYKYFFRKSMLQLAADYEGQANIGE